jgi:hypothetical protein
MANFGFHVVYRVHWLKAKARSDRWAEEQVLLSNEMDWVVIFLQTQARVWRDRAGAVANEVRSMAIDNDGVSEDAGCSYVPQLAGHGSNGLPNEGLQGHLCYAFRQEQMWLQFANLATQKFTDARK